MSKPTTVEPSAAVRIGGPAITIARALATRNKLTLRDAIEAVLIQVAERDNAARDASRAKAKARKAGKEVAA